MKHTLSVLVENKPGVLTRVAGLFARRGFNIESLAVGLSEDPKLSRITIVIDGDEHPVDQVTKQLHKLINVIKIRDLDPATRCPPSCCWCASPARATSAPRCCRSPRSSRPRSSTWTAASSRCAWSAPTTSSRRFCELLQPLGVLEVVRTGTIAMGRGAAADDPARRGRRGRRRRSRLRRRPPRYGPSVDARRPRAPRTSVARPGPLDAAWRGRGRVDVAEGLGGCLAWQITSVRRREGVMDSAEQSAGTRTGDVRAVVHDERSSSSWPAARAS